jgi:hypothetical protein
MWQFLKQGRHTVEPVYKGHSREPENVAFMSSCPSYTGKQYMHYWSMGKIDCPL